MNKWIIISALIPISLQPLFAANLGVFGSYWDTKDADTAYGWGGKIVLNEDGGIGAEIRGSYFEEFEEDAGGATIELEAIPLELGLTATLFSDNPVDLYVGAGGSYFLLDSKAGDIDDELGWYASGGLRITLSGNAALFAEAIYRQVKGTVREDDIEEIDGDVDIKLDGLGVNAGLLLNW